LWRRRTDARLHHSHCVYDRCFLEERDLLGVLRDAETAWWARAIRRAMPEAEHAATFDDWIIKKHTEVIQRQFHCGFRKRHASAHPAPSCDESLSREDVDDLAERRSGNARRIRQRLDSRARSSGATDESQADCCHANLSGEH